MLGLSNKWRVVAVAGPGCLGPFAVLAWYIHRYGVNVPFSDQWELVLLLAKSNASGVELSDLFAQHGEQRMLFPRFIMLSLARLTDWNIRAEMFVNLLLAVGIFAVLFGLLTRTLRPLGPWVAFPAAVMSLMIFSPVQWENWFWGWQISWYLPLFAFAFAAAVLWLWPEERPAWQGVALASGAAFVGQYSLLSATLIWVTCLIILYVRPSMRRYWWMWTGLGAVSSAIYLKDYVSPASMEQFHMPPSLLIQEPKRPLAYLLYLLGRPVLDHEPSYAVGALFLGAFLSITAYVLLFRRNRLRAASVWLAIGSYALLLGMMTTAGRLGIGLEFAGSSRYTTIGVMFMVATAALLSVALLPGRNGGTAPSRAPGVHGDGEATAEPSVWSARARTAAVVALWALVGGLFVADYKSEVDTFKLWHSQRLAIKECLIRATSPEDPCLLSAYPAPQAIYERAQYLKSIGWGGFEVDHRASQER